MFLLPFLTLLHMVASQKESARGLKLVTKTLHDDKISYAYKDVLRSICFMCMFVCECVYLDFPQVVIMARLHKNSWVGVSSPSQKRSTMTIYRILTKVCVYVGVLCVCLRLSAARRPSTRESSGRAGLTERRIQTIWTAAAPQRETGKTASRYKSERRNLRRSKRKNKQRASSYCCTCTSYHIICRVCVLSPIFSGRQPVYTLRSVRFGRINRGHPLVVSHRRRVKRNSGSRIYFVLRRIFFSPPSFWCIFFLILVYFICIHLEKKCI